MRNSAISSFDKCPYNYKLQYVDQLEVLPNQDPDNPLYVGTAIHYGAETESAKQMLECYTSNYYLIGNKHINEMIKLEVLLPKLLEVKHTLGIEFIHEYYFTCGTFHGTVDLIVQQEDGTVDLYDYKYCSKNSVEKYKESYQLHLYKYFLEQQGYKVGKLGFIFIPKTYIRQKQTEDLYQFRKRLEQELDKLQVTIHYLDYDHNKVIEAMLTGIVALETTDYRKNVSDACKFCPYQNYCLKQEDYEIMNLPSNTRREVVIDQNPDLWIYADSYVGKSTFIDQFDDLLFLNTDGNTDNTTSPVLRIKDEVTVNGRVTNTKFAWESFIEVIEELEKQHASGTLEFKRVALDLLEDLREHCRLYMYDKMGIQHESDAGYGKGYDIIQTQFLSTIKRLKNIGLQIIYISKELKETVTPKNGVAYNTFRPNIQEKAANVLAGTVDLTVRAYMEGDKRYIQLQKTDVEFGGGRFDFKQKRCELSKEAFLEALKEAQAGKKVKVEESKTQPVKEETPQEQPKTTKRGRASEPKEEPVVESVEEAPMTVDEFTKPSEEESTEQPPKEEAPKRRGRRKAAEIE